MVIKLYQNRLHYAFLFLGLGLGMIFFFSLQEFRFQVVLSLCFFYFIWGVVHHWLTKDLYFRIVLEYLLVALTGCVILLSVVWRAQGGNLL